MKNISTSIIIAVVFIWAGMVIGLSFLEAPLKFQAPGITLELGLGIGQLVFGALTKIEMGFSGLLIGLMLLRSSKMSDYLLFLLPIIIVGIDNVVLMPILDARVELILMGESIPESSAHWWYIGLELVKLLGLLIGGFIFINRNLNVDYK